MNSRTEKYVASTPLAHRKRFGQFFTPDPVADFMCQWVLGRKKQPAQVLDPAFGLGSFLEAVRRRSDTVTFVGYDIDEHVLRRAPTDQNAGIRLGDYLDTWGKKYDAIVCNPPYSRFQHFSRKDDTIVRLQRELGLEVSGYINSASAFLLKSLSELADGGMLAYILPLEFLNTGYGTVVKRQLLLGGRLKAIVKLECESDVFPDAITTVGIILACNDGRDEPVRFATVNAVSELPIILQSPSVRMVALASLDPDDKWLRHFNDHTDVSSHPDFVGLRTYGQFSRGIATGANEFFLLSKSDARNLRLPDKCLLPCVSKSRQVTNPVFTDDDFSTLATNDAPVYLFDGTRSTEGPVHDYIDQGRRAGYHLRYLTKMRSPWYALEKRAPAPILLGVFFRGRFKVVRNYSSSLNLTCFHGFYPNALGYRFVDQLFLFLYSQAAALLFAPQMRKYGDGLDKFEPNDLNAAYVPAPHVMDELPTELVAAGLKAVEKKSPLPQELESRFLSLMRSVDQQASQDRLSKRGTGRQAALPW